MIQWGFSKRTAIISCITGLVCYSANAEITRHSTNSFTVEHSFTANADYSAAVHEFGLVEHWWTSEGSLSGNGQNMFFSTSGLHENLPEGKTVTHLSKIEKGIWSGELGELKGQNVKGLMKVRVKALHHATKVTMEYTVTGEAIAENKNWPKNTDSLIGAQMDSLKKSIRKRKSQVRTTIR